MAVTTGSLRRSVSRWICALAVVASCLTGGAEAVASTTPFTQCPAIGAAPSCDILLQVKPDLTISVIGDPAVGPYDGGDDTLVGIVNNSASAISAITVSGPGSGLASFDGDGICTYATGGIVGAGFTGDSYCTSQQKAGTDPGDYSGPGTSFTLDPKSSDDVEVDFAGKGLAAGKSTYFSLEGALTAAVVTAHNGGLHSTYVALGDSYSSGEGLAPYQAGTDMAGDHCHRSQSEAYSDLLASSLLSSDTFIDRACSGATIWDLYNGFVENNEDSQLNHLTAQTGVVTIGVGGDDVGFSNVLGWCITGLDHGASDNCQSKMVQDPIDPLKKVSLNTRENELMRQLGQDFYCGSTSLCKPSLHELYSLISARSQSAHIYVLLYPHLFTNAPGRFGCVLAGPGLGRFAAARISRGNMQWINNGVDLLDQEINDEIARAQMAGLNVTAIDPRSLFNDTGGGASPGGHGVCTKHPWITGLHLRVGWPPYTSGSFHPNADGQAAFANAIAAVLK